MLRHTNPLLISYLAGTTFALPGTTACKRTRRCSTRNAAGDSSSFELTASLHHQKLLAFPPPCSFLINATLEKRATWQPHRNTKPARQNVAEWLRRPSSWDMNQILALHKSSVAITSAEVVWIRLIASIYLHCTSHRVYPTSCKAVGWHQHLQAY